MRLFCRLFAVRVNPLRLLTVSGIICGMLLFSQPAGGEQIREAILAGTWYPAEPDLLRQQIHRFLNTVDAIKLPGAIRGMIVPHAGYMYSGQVAAHAYKLLSGRKIDTVIVLAPSHRARFRGVSVYDRGGYRTPLGKIALNDELIAAIKRQDPEIRYVPAAHIKEHSLEIQLPFLQVVAPDFRLVPLVMGEQNLSTCRRLARTIADSIRDESVIIVASTDLSHFHPYEKARALDEVVIRHVRQMNPEGLARDLAVGVCEACGGGPMITALIAADLLGADHATVLNAANSGDVAKDRSRVVGYMSAVLWTNVPDSRRLPSDGNMDASADPLGADDKNLLHHIARQSIQAHLSGREIPLPRDLSSRLKLKQGAFVTLRKKGQLRGCIGHIFGYYPLAETVSRMAVAAATADPRFPPVHVEEFAELEYEISVMSPLNAIDDINTIQVGIHGIYLRRGNASGLLLPQVAIEYGWNRTTFLEQTCQKARLPKDAWQDPATKIFVFSTDVF